MDGRRGPDWAKSSGTATAALAVAVEEEKATVLERPKGSKFELEFPAHIEAVGPFCAYLNMVCGDRGWTESELQGVEIAAYETCLNIIEHAYGFDPEARIRVRINLGRKGVCLSFIDRGKGIDPKKIPPPNIKDPRVRRRGRGFGLQIIRKSVDVMRYRRTRDGENCLFLWKRLTRQAQREASVLAIRRGDPE